MEHEKYMKMAIDASRKSTAESPDKAHPLVGVVVVTTDNTVVTAFRGESGAGHHAEFAALETKLADAKLVGATVYTTLEPCTTRKHPKVPCATRLAERKVACVFIGMLDPNPRIQGNGVKRLQDAGIEVQLFPDHLAKEVQELNREFRRAQEVSTIAAAPSEKQLSELRARTLDEWYKRLNHTYWTQNYYRSAADIFSHLVEVVGGLSTLASDKKKSGVDPEKHMAKALAWWLTLCGKLGIKSVESMIWDKFPNVCSYCQRGPHEQDECNQIKSQNQGPNWSVLTQLGNNNADARPGRLKDWQKMFHRIYPAVQTEAYGPSFARLSEELGELSEAVRVFRAAPGYVLSEAADVFAWLMHIQNIADTKRGVSVAERGDALEKTVSKLYPNSCSDCGNEICNCRPILQKTIGRIAHEVPPGRASFGEAGRFLSPDNASKFFQDD